MVRNTDNAQQLDRTTVRFPHYGELTFHQYVYCEKSRQRNTYKLVAVINHIGNTYMSGHYFTYARVNGVWYKFDDAVVSRVSDSDLGNIV